MLVVDGDNRFVGRLPTLDLANPCWQEADELLSVVRERFGLDAVVLRLISASSPEFEPGAEVTYAVEGLGKLPADLPLERCDETLPSDDANPLRMPWARPGGVMADIEWADRELAKLGRHRVGPAAQIRTWNLSLLIRLATDQGVAWIKHVPPFMRHEGAILRLVREEGGNVPTVLAACPSAGLVLLDNVAGDDMYFADQDMAVRMIKSLVAIQVPMTERLAAIREAGAPDSGAASLLREVSHLVAREDVRRDLDATGLQRLCQLVSNLPSMLDALYSCGLKDTLVHGDFHAGNHRSNGTGLVLLDWGDSAIGHPLLDMTAFLERVPSEPIDSLRRAWIHAWSCAIPEASVSLAAELIRPIGALRQAVVYQQFLDSIEPSERVYHRVDVPKWLKRAIAMAGDYS